MESENIRILIDKYWNCETTVEEEKLLQHFFARQEIPEELAEFAPLFRYREEMQLATVSADFEQKLQTAIHQQEKERNYITIKIFAPALRIAASIALIIGMGTGIYFMATQNRRNYFAETYNDPNAAFKHAAFALDKLSDALRKGEQASMQSLRELEDLNVDWPAPDSLHSAETEEINPEIPANDQDL